MGTIAEKLEYLNGTKGAIKTAIEGKGVSVPDGTTFRGYAALIASMPSGGIYQEKTATPTGEQFYVLPDDGYDALSKVTVEGDTALKPWNIPEGTTIYGVVGTAKLAITTDPPSDLPVSKDDADTVLTENDATADVSTFDLMVLAQDDGNITYGYLSKGNGKASYNGVELPEFPDWDNITYPYAHIVKEDNNYFFSVTSSPLVPINTSSFGTNNAVNFINFQYNTVEEKWEKVSESTGYINKSYKTLVWTNTDILKSDGTVYLAAIDPVASGAFAITAYDPITTEFKAKGWRRLSYHTTGEQAGTWTYDDFTDTESGGWNYLKNIRSCSREKLYYQGVEVWPNMLYKQSLADSSWATISKISKSGNAESYYSIGDEKDIELTTGETLTLRIIGFNHDVLSDGTGYSGITFETKHLMSSKLAMNSSNTNVGGWRESAMRTRLQPGGSIYNVLPQEVQDVIRPVNKVTSVGNAGSALETTSDYAFLLSEVEIFGSASFSVAGEGKQYDYYGSYATTSARQIKNLANGTGSANSWWERSPYNRNTTYFCSVYSNGGSDLSTASSSLGVSFGFCV